MCILYSISFRNATLQILLSFFTHNFILYYQTFKKSVHKGKKSLFFFIFYRCAFTIFLPSDATTSASSLSWCNPTFVTQVIMAITPGLSSCNLLESNLLSFAINFKRRRKSHEQVEIHSMGGNTSPLILSEMES